MTFFWASSLEGLLAVRRRRRRRKARKGFLQDGEVSACLYTSPGNFSLDSWGEMSCLAQNRHINSKDLVLTDFELTTAFCKEPESTCKYFRCCEPSTVSDEDALLFGCQLSPSLPLKDTKLPPHASESGYEIYPWKTLLLVAGGLPGKTQVGSSEVACTGRGSKRKDRGQPERPCLQIKGIRMLS